MAMLHPSRSFADIALADHVDRHVNSILEYALQAVEAESVADDAHARQLRRLIIGEARSLAAAENARRMVAQVDRQGRKTIPESVPASIRLSRTADNVAPYVSIN